MKELGLPTNSLSFSLGLNKGIVLIIDIFSYTDNVQDFHVKNTFLHAMVSTVCA